MGNHGCECVVCGEERRGIMGVDGCDTEREALLKNCSEYRDMRLRQFEEKLDNERELLLEGILK